MTQTFTLNKVKFNNEEGSLFSGRRLEFIGSRSLQSLATLPHIPRNPYDRQTACLALIHFTPLLSIRSQFPGLTAHIACLAAYTTSAHKGQRKITFCFPLKTQYSLFLRQHHQKYKIKQYRCLREKSFCKKCFIFPLF